MQVPRRYVVGSGDGSGGGELRVAEVGFNVIVDAAQKQQMRIPARLDQLIEFTVEECGHQVQGVVDQP